MKGKKTELRTNFIYRLYCLILESIRQEALRRHIFYLYCMILNRMVLNQIISLRYPSSKNSNNKAVGKTKAHQDYI